ncbi:hypothetical protein UPYG_G00095990 [Umbra pygmaea]|uniref:Uncharacterized protein n=1 Tax=Umbra pygmaea TaxID=75934 RepID=A0ABD0XMH3_UMBPY
MIRECCPHVLHVLSTHDVTDNERCLFWILGKKDPAHLDNRLNKVLLLARCSVICWPSLAYCLSWSYKVSTEGALLLDHS